MQDTYRHPTQLRRFLRIAWSFSVDGVPNGRQLSGYCLECSLSVQLSLVTKNGPPASWGAAPPRPAAILGAAPQEPPVPFESSYGCGLTLNRADGGQDGGRARQGLTISRLIPGGCDSSRISLRVPTWLAEATTPADLA